MMNRTGGALPERLSMALWEALLRLLLLMFSAASLCAADVAISGLSTAAHVPGKGARE